MNKRQIKFREWDSKQKEMIPFEDIGRCGDDVYLSDFWTSTYKDGSEQIMLQWTGLLDKNGKEIYEGDIVVTLSGSIGIVVFHDGAFCVQSTFLHDLKPDSEIIGNVWENPELLKQ